MFDVVIFEIGLVLVGEVWLVFDWFIFYILFYVFIYVSVVSDMFKDGFFWFLCFCRFFK